MDIKQLRCFLTLAEEKHFGRAAARLHIVQPALSMQLKSLESELGGPLFLRTSRHVELTEAGGLLLAEAGRIIEQLEHAEHNVRRSLRGEVGRVRIGFEGNAVFSGKLGEDMSAFHQQYPEAELALEELLPEVQLDGILNGRLDIGYCSYIDDIQPDPRLNYLALGQWRSVLLISAGHRLARKKDISELDLRDETMIVYAKSQTEEQVRQYFIEQAGFVPAAFRLAASSLSAISLVTAGFGYTVAPMSMQALRIPGLVMRPLKKYQRRIPLMLAYRKLEPGSAVRAYIDLVKSGDGSG